MLDILQKLYYIIIFKKEIMSMTIIRFQSMPTELEIPVIHGQLDRLQDIL